MDKKEFQTCFENYLDKCSILIKEEQIEQFYNYMNLLIEWNQKMNLTAIVEPRDIILKHFIDSLMINEEIPDTAKILDVGTGAGFPGIPLKIAKPNTEVTLLDSLNKRLIFLDEVIRKLKLVNVETIHARAEELGKNKQYRETYDIVVSRAVADLRILIEYMLPFVKIGGKCISMKGPNIEEETKNIEDMVKILGGKVIDIKEVTLPEENMKRNIIVIQKINQTPEKFPRRHEKIAKNKDKK